MAGVGAPAVELMTGNVMVAPPMPDPSEMEQRGHWTGRLLGAVAREGAALMRDAVAVLPQVASEWDSSGALDDAAARAGELRRGPARLIAGAAIMGLGVLAAFHDTTKRPGS